MYKHKSIFLFSSRGSTDRYYDNRSPFRMSVYKRTGLETAAVGPRKGSKDQEGLRGAS